MIKGDDTWASTDHNEPSEIEANRKLFACCYLCDHHDEEKIVPLEVVLSSYSTNAAPAVGGGVGKGTSSGKGKEPQDPHNDHEAGDPGSAHQERASTLSDKTRAREESPHAPSKKPKASGTRV